jgi:hypothetical protein
VVEISTVFEIFRHFLFKGDGPPYMVMAYIPSDAPYYYEQEYIQFWDGEINKSV